MPTQTVVESFTERELAAWRRFLRTHAGLVKELDADLEAEPTRRSGSPRQTYAPGLQ